jgi:1-phosphofructokinase
LDDLGALSVIGDVEVAVFAPATLLHIEIHSTANGDDEIHLHAGGQGYWISKMIQALGARAIPCAPVGGEPGDALASLIAADGLDPWLVRTARPNAVHVDDRRAGDPERIAETSIEPLGRHEVDELYSAVVGAAMRAGVCVIAGTQLAPMFDTDTFRRLVADLRGNGIKVVADLSGDDLRSALQSGVDVAKLGHDELIGGGWATGDSVAAVADGIAEVAAAGASTVVVSRRHRTTVAGTPHGVFEVRSPKLEVLDGRGGGDSMTAALAVGAALDLDPRDSLRLAAAAGALNVSRHGLGTGRGETILEIARRVEVVGVGAGDLADMSMAELRAIAARRGIRGRTSMRRAELIEALADRADT